MDYLALIIGISGGFVIGFLIAQTRSASLKGLNQKLESDNSNLKTDLELLRASLQQEQKSSTEWKINFENQRQRLEEQKAELESIQEKFSKEFELVANRILEEKSIKFTDQNKQNLDTILNPLKERITEFQKKVEDNNVQSAERTAALKNQIEELKKLNQEITSETKSLTQALKGDSKTQGNWGELQLESILEKAGLEKGIHYSKETNIKTEDGANQRLDYIINLPDGKHLILDSKVSLTAYSNYCDTDDEGKRTSYLKQHLDSINNHIKLLGTKDYQNLHSINTPDYVMMFIANEPALTIALKEDHSLFEKALDRNIVLVSTSTLLATLRTISYIWKQDLQNRNAEEIARQAASLYDKFVGFSEDLIKLGNQLNTVSITYEESMKKLSSGKDNLIRKTERLKELGVNPSKRMDQRLLDRSDEKNLD